MDCPAAGAGVGIALAGDIVVAARSAKFVLSFVKLGAVLDGGTSLLVQRTIGTARARALAMTGDTLMAETAAEWGLILPRAAAPAAVHKVNRYASRPAGDRQNYIILDGKHWQCCLLQRRVQGIKFRRNPGIQGQRTINVMVAGHDSDGGFGVTSSFAQLKRVCNELAGFLIA